MITVDFDVRDIDWVVDLLDSKDLARIPGKVVTALSRRAKTLYERTVDTWEMKPTFEVLKDIKDQQATFIVGTDDPIYGYVDFGTPPHIIKAKNKSYLTFRVGGRPKTIPGRLRSFQGSAGDKWVRVKEVRHPGIAPRRFSEMIEADLLGRIDPTIGKKIDEVLMRYMTKSRQKSR